MKSKYTVDYFIKKFSAIPEENWTSFIYRSVDGGSKCALGHCGESNRSATIESIALKKMFARALKIQAAVVNDGVFELGDTPKERILNALELIKAGVKI